MTLYSDPPELRTFSQDKPTLLVCWWITIFCTTIVILRVIGRYVRTERLFAEDKLAALAIIPLFLRMGCVHVVLVYGTNNAQLADAGLSDDQLHHRSVASGLVLASRILYAATYVFFFSSFSFSSFSSFPFSSLFPLFLLFSFPSFSSFSSYCQVSVGEGRREYISCTLYNI